MWNADRRFLAFVAAALLTLPMPTSKGDIVVTERESWARLYVFAGAGGAVDAKEHVDSTTALTGTFFFDQNFGAQVSGSQQYSTGSAAAAGDMSLFDSVQQNSAGSLNLALNRQAETGASYYSGTASANALAGQVFRVRFDVTGEAVNYTLSGLFDPGVTSGFVGEYGQLAMYRPFTNQFAFNYTSATALNTSGTLDPGTYELYLAMTDLVSATSTSVSNSDFSSADFTLNFSSAVPEPSSSILFCLGGVGVVLRRKPRRR